MTPLKEHNHSLVTDLNEKKNQQIAEKEIQNNYLKCTQQDTIKYK